MKNEKKFYVIGELKGPTMTIYVGISEPPKESYKHDIVHLKIKGKSISVMTPREAVLLGVFLIRASILADFKLQEQEEGWEWATNWEQFFK